MRIRCRLTDMRQSIVIPGRLPGLNEYTESNRRNPYAGAKVKAELTEHCQAYFMEYLNIGLMKPIRNTVDIDIWWYEQNDRRDPDNIYSALKFVLDGAVKAGVLPDDNRKYVRDISHHVRTDKEDPRIEITFSEVRK